MSGPKISVYSLERERQRLLAAIRKCDQQRTEFIIENSQLLSDLSQLLDDICEDKEKIIGLHCKSEKNEEKIQSFTEMESILSEFLQDATSLQSINRPVKNGKVTLTREELRKHEESLQQLKLLNQKVKKIDDQIRERYKILHEYSFSLLKKDIRNRSAVTSIDFTHPADRAKNELQNLKNDMLSEINLRVCSGKYSIDILSLAEKIRLDIQKQPSISSLKSYEKITLKQFYSRLESETVELTRCKVLREAYIQACDEAGISPDPVIPDCGNAVRIEEAIEKINQMMIQKDARSYIMDTVDDVMSEMGYEVIGSRDVTKKNGRHFHDELYSYSSGTAINIIYSSDGQITMELGGLSHDDDLPNQSETELLTEEMQTFCSSFSTIEKKLAERGVLVGSRIALAPPDAEYAMKINLNDYQLRKDNVETLHDIMDQDEFGKNSTGRPTNRMSLE